MVYKGEVSSTYFNNLSCGKGCTAEPAQTRQQFRWIPAPSHPHQPWTGLFLFIFRNLISINGLSNQKHLVYCISLTTSEIYNACSRVRRKKTTSNNGTIDKNLT